MTTPLQLAVSALALACAAWSHAAQAEVITFDNLTHQGREIIPAGYAGLSWDGFTALRRADAPPDGPGFVNGITSGDYAAYIYQNASFSSATPFYLLSMELTKAREAGHTLFTGYLNQKLVGTLDVAAGVNAPTLVNFHWASKVDRVTVAINYAQHSVMDDIVISQVPEPATGGMLLAGLALLGVAARRRPAAR